MHKVLFITYDFPPDAMGVRRVVKFCEYLPDFRWMPIVLTVKARRGIQINDSVLDALDEKGIKVFRCGSADPYRMSYKIKKMLFMGKKTTSPQEIQQSSGIVKRISSSARRWLFIPDDRNLWVPFAVRKGLSIIKKEKPDVIITTSYPSSTHLVGLMLKKLTNIPWVADFRDGWLQNTVFYNPPTSIHRGIQTWLEKMVAENADMIISVCEPITEYFALLTYDKEKCMTITNGYDPEDFKRVEPRSIDASGKCVFLYTGTLFAPRGPEPLFRALKLLLQQKRHLVDKIRLVFLSVLSEKDFELIRRLRLQKIVSVEGLKSYQECIAYQKGADILVLIIHPDENPEIMMTQKVFEYLASKKPILAIAPPGACSQLIQSLNAGVCVPYDNVDAIKDAIADLFGDWCKGSLQGVTPAMLQQFSRRTLAERLAFALYRVLRSREENE